MTYDDGPMTTDELRVVLKLGYPMLMSRANMKLLKFILISRDDARVKLDEALRENATLRAEQARLQQFIVKLVVRDPADLTEEENARAAERGREIWAHLNPDGAQS